MTPESNHLLQHFQVRKTKAQKIAFRNWLTGTLKDAGYMPKVETSRSLVWSHNVVVGDPEHASIIFSAHYDTCAALPIPNLITPRNLLLFLLYQIALVIPMFALAIGAEVLLLTCWDNCPMWLAMLVVYLVLGFCFWFVMAGPANKHNANDNTSGVAVLLEIALSLSPERREQVAFVFFDNEEKGLLGSSQFKKSHGKRIGNTPVINFDCVSDGDYILFFPTKQAKKSDSILSNLEQAYPSHNAKQTEVVRGFGIYPSDQRAFPVGIGVAAVHKGRFGYWLGRIHTNRDTIFDDANIELLRSGSLSLISILIDD